MYAMLQNCDLCQLFFNVYPIGRALIPHFSTRLFPAGKPFIVITIPFNQFK